MEYLSQAWQEKFNKLEQLVSSMESREKKLAAWQERLEQKEKELEQREAHLLSKRAKFSVQQAQFRRLQKDLNHRAAWLDQQHVTSPPPLDFELLFLWMTCYTVAHVWVVHREGKGIRSVGSSPCATVTVYRPRVAHPAQVAYPWFGLRLCNIFHFLLAFHWFWSALLFLLEFISEDLARFLGCGSSADAAASGGTERDNQYRDKLYQFSWDSAQGI